MGIIRKSYKKNKNEKISKHFTVAETSSTSPSPYNPSRVWSDECLYDEKLVELLEKLIDTLQAKAAFVSSWYRTPSHDVAVGGNGKGKHCTGQACDIAFKDKSGNYIDTRYISCIAQDLGFTGIARISDKFIHLDTRTGSKYYGDETKSYNTVTSNFYSYYGLTKDAVYKKFGTVPDTNASDNVTVTYQVYTTKWLPTVTNGKEVTSYAGVDGKKICAVKINTSEGSVMYRVHANEINSWTPWVSSANKSDFASLIGTGFTIDAIQMRPESGGFNLHYKVSSTANGKNYYSEVTNDRDYAGSYGKPIDKLVVRID